MTTGGDRARGVAIQSDDKIVAVADSCGTGCDAVVLRYTKTGTLDPAFGIGGRVTADFGGLVERTTAVAIIESPGGRKIIVGGGGGPNADFVLARYDDNGVLDPTFGNGGMVLCDFGFSDGINALAVASDGKIVAVGSSAETGLSRVFAVARFNADGSPDLTFSEDGKLTKTLGKASANATGVLVQDDGKIVIGGDAAKKPGKSKLRRRAVSRGVGGSVGGRAVRPRPFGDGGILPGYPSRRRG